MYVTGSCVLVLFVDFVYAGERGMRSGARTVTRVRRVQEPKRVRLVGRRGLVLHVLEVPEGKRVEMGGYMRLVGTEIIIFRRVVRVGRRKRCAENINRDKTSIGKE